ncbi:hypothetical protein KA183_13925 [bacterium]|nr:hypothetical protein [bacterium]
MPLSIKINMTNKFSPATMKHQNENQTTEELDEGSKDDPGDIQIPEPATNSIPLSVAEKTQFYIAERNNQANLLVGISQSIDKFLISMSAATLTLSVTIRWNIQGAVTCVEALYACWIFMISCLVLMMLSMFFSENAFRRYLEDIDSEYENALVNRTYEVPENKWNKYTTFMERMAAFVFFVGLIALLVFAMSNAPNTSNEKNSKVDLKSEEKEMSKKELAVKHHSPDYEKKSESPIPAKKPAPAPKPTQNQNGKKSGHK